METQEIYEARARFNTEKGSTYITRLCKHFAHKVEVDYSETEGWAALPGSEARMYADSNSLRFEITSNTNEGLLRGMFIIQDHIVKFAFRENLEKLDWESSKK